MSGENGLLDTFTTFGDLLKYLRVRAHLTQRDLSIAVGYSEAQISRQESNKRVPSEYALKALFVPALGLEHEPEVVARLLRMAEKAREKDRAWDVSNVVENAPQPAAAPVVRHNLPRPLSSFIGREKEIDQVVRLVREHPLVTLTGTGGVGKTRLALHAAKALINDFPDGVWLVELAPVIDPVFVPIAVASIFKVHSATGQRLMQSLREYFASKRLLLILDNCEHIINAVAEMSMSLLEGCPNLSILATSREILDVEGEYFIRCPSLSLPVSSPARASTSQFRRVEESEAVRLFVDRAAAASPGFLLTEQNAIIVTEICRRLDGIPLAIELAAARLRLLSLEQVAEYLDDIFGLLSGSRLSAQPRHKTLKALIEWSYQLLSPPEQTLLRQLSVFAGGWTLAAAQAMAVGEGIEPAQVIGLMSQLVDKSLIFVEAAETGENRYHMLETIRQYANERLREAGENELARDRHLAFFASITEKACPFDAYRFPDLTETHRLLREWDNICLALNCALETNIVLGLRFCISYFMVATNDLSLELSSWLERLLVAEAEERIRDGSQPEEMRRKLIRGRALMTLGEDRMFWGMRDQAARVLLESKAIFESLGEPGDYFAAEASATIATLILTYDPKQSLAYLESSRKYFEKANDKGHLANCDRILSALHLYLGNLVQAKQLAEESVRLCEEIGKPQMAAIDFLGYTAFLMGDFAQAVEYFHQMFLESQRYAELLFESYSISQEGWVTWARGDYERLHQLCEMLIHQGHETGCTNFFLGAEIIQALIEWSQGAYDQAEQRSLRTIPAFQTEYGSYIVPLVYILGRVALSRGEFRQAARYFHQVDEMSDGPRWKWRAYSLHSFGLLAAAQANGQPEQAERAAALFGAQEKLFHWLPNLLSPLEKREYALALRALQAILGKEVFCAAWASGQTMKHQEAFAYALADAA